MTVLHEAEAAAENIPAGDSVQRHATAAALDQVCVCGHRRRRHDEGAWGCMARDDGELCICPLMISEWWIANTPRAEVQRAMYDWAHGAGMRAPRGVR